jgi:putative oxidoreductase
MAITDSFSTRYDSAGTDSVSSFGLLVLRIAVGATALQAGLIKAFDIDAAVSFMDDNGWKMGKFAAILVTATETAGGILLLLGLLTPVAACGLIAVMIDAWAVNVAGGPFWSQPFNVPFLVTFGATALLFTGAGAYSVDAKAFGRARWPGVITVGLFVVAIAAAVTTWVLLNGTNPLHFASPGA